MKRCIYCGTELRCADSETTPECADEKVCDIRRRVRPIAEVERELESYGVDVEGFNARLLEKIRAKRAEIERKS